MVSAPVVYSGRGVPAAASLKAAILIILAPEIIIILINYYNNNKIRHLTQLTYEPRSDKRTLLALNVKSEIFTGKKDLAVVNNYRKFEKIIFTNNKGMSVLTRIYDAF